MSKYGIFLVRISAFGLSTGKNGPEKTPYLDTFHAVKENWNTRNELKKKIRNTKTTKYFNIKKLEINMKNSSSHFKLWQENFRSRYKRAKQIF